MVNKRILLEDSYLFQPDHSKTATRVLESRTGAGSLKAVDIHGTFSVCGVRNGNGRVYPTEVWEANVKPGSHLMQLIERNAAFGTLEHPQSGVVTLESPISHMVTAVKLESDGRVSGVITIFDDLPEGKKLRVLIENGYNPLVSSRGFGSVVRIGNDDVVQNDFICEGWDVVAVPSFPQAKLAPEREPGMPAQRPTTVNLATTESLQGPSSVAGLPRVAETNNTMNINELRVGVAALGRFDPLAASATELAEAFASINRLGNEATALAVSTPGLAYEVGRTGKSLEETAAAWHSKISGLVSENAALRKTTAAQSSVLNETVRVAAGYRKQLASTAERLGRVRGLFTEANNSARSWQARSVKAIAEGSVREQELQVTCDALQILAERHVALERGQVADAPVTEAVRDLAARLVAEQRSSLTWAKRAFSLQYASATPEQLAKLGECKTAADVQKLEESMKPAAGTPAAGKPAINESQPAGSQPAAAAPSGQQVSESVVEQGSTGLSDMHSLTMAEAIAIVRRTQSPSTK